MLNRKEEVTVKDKKGKLHRGFKAERIFDYAVNPWFL